MPTYSHQCTNPECNHEWDEEYSIKADPPKLCPKCGQETAKRIISFPIPGKVELYGQDLKAKLFEDGQKIKAQAHRSEKIYANMIGEDKYQSIQSEIDRKNRNR